MSPDAALFHAHLETAPYLAGVDEGKWTLHEGSAWPHPIIWIQADQELITTGKVFLRFTLDGYPQNAPSACPWDIERNSPLDPTKWPRGPGNVSQVFNTGWNGAQSLYCPCDRAAMPRHEIWKSQFPNVWWQASFTIVVYLEFIFSILNRRKYAGG